MEYVGLEASQHDILKKLHILERKVEIAEVRREMCRSFLTGVCV